MTFEVGQVAGWGLVDVMRELIRKRDIGRAREAVAQTREELANERVRMKEALRREYQHHAGVYERAAQADYDLETLLVEAHLEATVG